MCRLLMSTWQCLCVVIRICKEPSVLVFLIVLVLKDFTKDRDGTNSVPRDGYCYVSSKGWCALLVLVFRLFQKPENRQFRFFEQKSESKNYWPRLFQKPEKDWQFSGKNQPSMESGYMAGYLKKIQTKFENPGYTQAQVLDFWESHFQCQRTVLITVRGIFLFLINTKHYWYTYYIRPSNSVKK